MQNWLSLNLKSKYNVCYLPTGKKSGYRLAFLCYNFPIQVAQGSSNWILSKHWPYAMEYENINKFEIWVESSRNFSDIYIEIETFAFLQSRNLNFLNF